jgi:hypothetical protein
MDATNEPEKVITDLLAQITTLKRENAELKDTRGERNTGNAAITQLKDENAQLRANARVHANFKAQITDLTTQVEARDQRLKALEKDCNDLLDNVPQDAKTSRLIVQAVVNVIKEANETLQSQLDRIPTEFDDDSLPDAFVLGGNFLGIQTLLSNFERVFKHLQIGIVATLEQEQPGNEPAEVGPMSVMPDDIVNRYKNHSRNDLIRALFDCKDKRANASTKTNDTLYGRTGSLENQADPNPVLEDGKKQLAEMKQQLDNCLENGKAFQRHIKRLEDRLREVRGHQGTDDFVPENFANDDEQLHEDEWEILQKQIDEDFLISQRFRKKVMHLQHLLGHVIEGGVLSGMHEQAAHPSPPPENGSSDDNDSAAQIWELAQQIEAKDREIDALKKEPEDCKEVRQQLAELRAAIKTLLQFQGDDYNHESAIDGLERLEDDLDKLEELKELKDQLGNFLHLRSGYSLGEATAAFTNMDKIQSKRSKSWHTGESMRRKRAGLTPSKDTGGETIDESIPDYMGLDHGSDDPNVLKNIISRIRRKLDEKDSELQDKGVECREEIYNERLKFGSEKDFLQKKINDLNAKIRFAQVAEEAYEEEKESLTKDIENKYIPALTKYHNEKQALERKIADLKKKLRKCEDNCRDLAKEMRDSRLRTTGHALESPSEANSQMGGLRSINREQEGLIKELKRELEELQKDYQNLQREDRLRMEENQSYGTTLIEERVAAYQALQRENDLRGQQKIEFEKLLHQWQDYCEEVKKTLQADINRKQEQLVDCKKIIDGHRESHILSEELKLEKKLRDDEKRNSDQKLDALQRRGEKMRKKMQEEKIYLQQQVHDLSENLKDWDWRNNQLQLENNDLNREFQDLKAERDRLAAALQQKEQGRHSQELASADSDNSDEVHKLNDIIYALESQEDILKDEIARLKEALKKCKYAKHP